MLTRVDGDVLGGYCMAWATFVELTADIAEHGAEYRVGTNGALANRPAVSRLARATDDMRKYAAELGIGAASRSKIEVRKHDDADEDPTAKAIRIAAVRK